MRSHSKTKSILCYGDSNTWGYVPSSFDAAEPIKRYQRHERWTGILQNLLGNKYYVIEEGLNSRTTNIDYAKLPDRNGKNYLPSCLYSHAPLDLVVLALGGNDTKTYFNRTAEDIAEGLGELVDIIQQSSYGHDMMHPPRILITAPAIPLSIAETHIDEQGVSFFERGIEKIKKLPALFEKLSKNKNCEYIDLSTAIVPSQIDGIHYDSVAHFQCASLLRHKIIEIFST